MRQEREELEQLLKLRQCIPADFAAGRWAPIGVDGVQARCESTMHSSVDAMLYSQDRPPSAQRAAVHLSAIDARIQELQHELGLPVDPARKTPRDANAEEDSPPITRQQCVWLVEFRDRRLVDAYDRAAERFQLNNGIIGDLAKEEKALTEDLPSTSEWAAARDGTMWMLETTSRLVMTASRFYEAQQSSIIEQPVPPAKLILKAIEGAKSMDEAVQKLTEIQQSHIAQRTRLPANTLEEALTRALTSLTNVDRLQQVTQDREALKTTVSESLAHVRSAIAGYTKAVAEANQDIDDIDGTKAEIDRAVRNGCDGAPVRP